MGSGGAGGHHHAVDSLFGDDLLHAFLCILGTGKQIVLHMDHVGQGLGVVSDRRDIGNPPYVDAAVAHKNANAWFFSGKVVFRRQLFGPCHGPSGLRQYLAGSGGGRRGLHDRLGDVLWALEYAAEVNSLSACADRRKALCLSIMMFIQFNPDFFGQLDDIIIWFQANRQYYHVKGLLFDFT